MRFLRRRSTDDQVDQDTASVATGDPGAARASGTADASGNGQVRTHTPGKGRPTPKRREAEGRRRGPAPPPPRTQREAMKLAKQNRGSRQERRQEAAERRARMLAGDERALMPRDRGPVKAYVRDVVDSRRHMIGLFMPLAALVFVSLMVPNPRVQSTVSLFCMVMLAAIIIEGLLLGRRVANAARVKFPKEQISGVSLGWYAFSRASQLRRLRVPKPRVRLGEKV